MNHCVHCRTTRGNGSSSDATSLPPNTRIGEHAGPAGSLSSGSRHHLALGQTRQVPAAGQTRPADHGMVGTGARPMGRCSCWWRCAMTGPEHRRDLAPCLASSTPNTKGCAPASASMTQARSGSARGSSKSRRRKARRADRCRSYRDTYTSPVVITLALIDGLLDQEPGSCPGMPAVRPGLHDHLALIRSACELTGGRLIELRRKPRGGEWCVIHGSSLQRFESLRQVCTWVRSRLAGGEVATPSGLAWVAGS